jgi:hypothetical protein
LKGFGSRSGQAALFVSARTGREPIENTRFGTNVETPVGRPRQDGKRPATSIAGLRFNIEKRTESWKIDSSDEDRELRDWWPHVRSQ